MKTVSVRKREINIASLEDWIVEDTHGFDTIEFTIDEDVSDLHLYMLYKNRNNDGGYDALEGNVWTPSQSFTAISGLVKIQLIAVDTDSYPTNNNIRWSTKYATLNIQENIETDTLIPVPEESQLEEIAGDMV